MHTVLVSRTFQRQFNALDKNLQKRIRLALNKLEENPIYPRPGADIKPLRDTKPQKHRLRVGDYRIIVDVREEIRILNVLRVGHRKNVYD